MFLMVRKLEANLGKPDLINLILKPNTMSTSDNTTSSTCQTNISCIEENSTLAIVTHSL